ncbi:MAG: hypothetical protein HY552_01735 [Elusimicrobia bacterium]|nr:hypothetical protein [Elusimicrobiota bacterium]
MRALLAASLVSLGLSAYGEEFPAAVGRASAGFGDSLRRARDEELKRHEKNLILEQMRGDSSRDATLWAFSYRSGDPDEDMFSDRVNTAFWDSALPNKILVFAENAAGLDEQIRGTYDGGRRLRRLVILSQGASTLVESLRAANPRAPGPRGLDRAFAPGAEIFLQAPCVGSDGAQARFMVRVGRKYLSRNGGWVAAPRGACDWKTGILGSGKGYLRCLVRPGGTVEFAENVDL